jgi:nucleoside-diphosphate-sugar epimerase
MKTDNKNITRDYIGPKDLHQLVMKLAKNNFLNTSVDCFTKDPTDKFSILELMKSKFGLKYEIINSNSGINAYGSRDNYFSVNYKANSFGYEPSLSSLDNIAIASEALLR